MDVGDSVEVTGTVDEFQGTTELGHVSASDVQVLPGTRGKVQPLRAPWRFLDTDAEKEAHEGELVAPRGRFTVTDNYDTNYYAVVPARRRRPARWSSRPRSRTPRTPTPIAAVEADNAARAITLDDGASTNFNSRANKATPLPWLGTDNPVRVGSPVTFHQPVVLEYRYGAWNLQPTHHVTDEGRDVATFSDTRTAAPEDVGGDVRLATFNVLNYFPTTGEEYEAAGSARARTTPTATATRSRSTGAARRTTPVRAAPPTTTNLQRQQAKIVTAINTLGADIVSLEEIENSVKFGKDRDAAARRAGRRAQRRRRLADAGPRALAGPADLPPLAEQDVIRTAFIYRPPTLEPVGPVAGAHSARPAFANAREPLAQAFKPAGAPRHRGVPVIVNHFKSKGSGVDDGTGQGNANPDRVAQAEALSAFADDVDGRARHRRALFLTGDFNAYTEEDPIQVLVRGRLHNLQSPTPTAASGPTTTPAWPARWTTCWPTTRRWPTSPARTSGTSTPTEAVAFEYSRYNYNATDFYAPDQFRASDHDPELVGLDLGVG